LKFAESFEKSGDFKSSARLYGELFNTNPKVPEYFDGLVRSYKAMNQFTELIPFIEKKLSISKAPELYGIYGEMLWRTGKPQEANKSWEDGLKSIPNDKSTYDKIADYQIAVKQFEKAIDTYEKGRLFFKTDVIYSDQLSQLYTAIGNVEKGLTEILKSFEYTHNTPIAEGRLSALKLIKGGDLLIDKELNNRYSNTDNPEGYRLLIWHLRSSNNFEKSLELTIKLDKIMNANGNELYNFAKVSQNDGNYAISLKTYELILQKGERNPFFQNSLFGIARTLEQQMELDTKFDNKALLEIISKYQDIVKKYPQTNAAYECQLRIGLINLNYLKNIEAAKKEFLTLYNVKINYQAVAEAVINLGKIALMENNLDAAKRYFNESIYRFGSSYPVIRDEAKLSIADIYFYKGEVDSALTFYKEASLMSNSNISNNALELMDIIENNKTQNLALREYANSLFLERQGNLDSAITLLRNAVKSGGGSDLEEVAALKICKIYFEHKDNLKAVNEFKAFLEKYPSSIFADYADFNLGKTYFQMKNYPEADKALKDLLVNYPRSLFLAEARKMIRIISDEEKKKIN
jgi:tetratricopeptide (TPR) repeat protein